MRNDGRDELDVLPSLRPDPADRDDLNGFPDFPGEPLTRRSAEQSRAPEAIQQAAVPVARNPGNGALWTLVVALLIALAGLGWWSYQQINLMGRQLVATQESFAQISEEAAGRIQDISGKVVATESNVTTESESLKLRVKQLEGSLAEVLRQQQAWVTLQSARDSRVESLSADIGAQRSGSAEIDTRLKTLTEAQAALKSEQAALKSGQTDAKAVRADVGRLETRLRALASEVELLTKNGNQGLDVRTLEQDLLVLRTQLENRSAQSGATEEFDAFRAQVSRNINTLQSQVQNLQQQIDARPRVN